MSERTGLFLGGCAMYNLEIFIQYITNTKYFWVGVGMASRYIGFSADSFLGIFSLRSYASVMVDNGADRSQVPHMPNSFSRLVSSPSSPHPRSRTSTLQTVFVASDLGLEMTNSGLDEDSKEKREDIFEKSSLVSGAEGTVRDVSEMESPQDVPEGFDELPIELISLIDR